MHTCIECRIQMAAMRLERVAQRSGSASAGFAMTFCHFFLQRFELRKHSLGRLLAQRLSLCCIQTGLAGFDRCCIDRRCFLSSQRTNFVGPNGYGRQRRIGHSNRRIGLLQRSIKSGPNCHQLAAGGLQLRRVFQIHTRPGRVCHQRIDLSPPCVHIVFKRLATGACLLQRLGGQDLNALRQQDSRFALNHRLMLQILNPTHHIAQTVLQTGQRLTRKWRTGLGGITLPGHGIGNVQPRPGQQLFCLVDPLGQEIVLLTQAPQFVHALLEHLGRTFVTSRHLPMHFVQLLQRGLALQPQPKKVAAIAGMCGRKGATGLLIQKGNVRC